MNILVNISWLSVCNVTLSAVVAICLVSFVVGFSLVRSAYQIHITEHTKFSA